MNYLALVEAYVNGELSSKELIDFEREMSTDAALRKQVEYEKMSKLLIHEAANSEIAADIRGIRKIGAARKKSILRRLFIVVPIAATVLFVVGVFKINNYDNPSIFVQEQYTNYKPNFSSYRGGFSNDTIMELLASSKGKEAENILIQESPKNLYLLGHAYFMQAEYQEAVKAFEGVIDSNVIENAAFYKALSRIASGDVERGKSELVHISNAKGQLFKVPATKILEDL